MNIDVEQLKQFKEMKFGWITPENDIISCKLHRHIDVLPSVYKARYQELLDRHYEYMNATLDAEQENLSDDEYYHPAMHRFNPHADAMVDILNELYEVGYVRIGYYGDVLEVSGDKDRIGLLSDQLSFMVDVLELKKWTRRKY